MKYSKKIFLITELVSEIAASRFEIENVLHDIRKKEIECTQEELAKVLEVSSSTIYRWENKKVPKWLVYVLVLESITGKSIYEMVFDSK